jgi:hypothetical protein
MAEVAILRGSELLRQDTLPLPTGPVKVVARRTDHELSLQLANHKAISFLDLLPPRPVVDGVWGIELLSQARATALVVRRAPATAAAAASPLDAGDRLFRAGRFADALDAFDEQQTLATATAALPTQQEAQLKAARCLVRLNRGDDALARLRELAGPSEVTPLVVLARFELWKQLLLMGKYREASDVFATIQTQHDLASIAPVLAESPRREILLLHTARLTLRKSLLEPGLRPKLVELQAVSDYFAVPPGAASEELMLLGQLQSIEDAAAVARRTAALFAREQDSAIWPAEPAMATGQEWDRVRDWCMIGRLAGRPEVVGQRLDLFLLSPNGQPRNDLAGLPRVLLVERARSHYLLGEDAAAAERLTQMLADPSADVYLIRPRMEAWLLLGFVRERQGDAAAAAEAWRKGAGELAARGAELGPTATGRRELVPEMALLSLANMLDDAQYQRFVEFAASRLGSVTGGEQLVKQLVPSHAVLQQLFVQPRGKALAEQVAAGNLLTQAQVKELLIVLAARMMADGAFVEQVSAEQEQLVWDLSRSGFFAFVDDRLSLPTLLQLGLAWKGVPAPFGWKLALAGLPEQARGPAAYVLSHRMTKRGRDSDAQALLTIATEISPPDSPVRRLTQQP